MRQITSIRGYHAHVYFEAKSREKAQTLCETAARLFGVALGHLHDGPVGPHPMASCQLGATPVQFAQLLPWLVLNRQGLVVFAHPETGADLADHRDHGIWLGCGLTLDLSIFS